MSDSPMKRQSRLRLAERRSHSGASGSARLLFAWLKELWGCVLGNDRRRANPRRAGCGGKNRELRILRESERQRRVETRTTGKQARLFLISEKGWPSVYP